MLKMFEQGAKQEREGEEKEGVGMEMEVLLLPVLEKRETYLVETLIGILEERERKERAWIWQGWGAMISGVW